MEKREALSPLKKSVPSFELKLPQKKPPSPLILQFTPSPSPSRKRTRDDHFSPISFSLSSPSPSPSPSPSLPSSSLFPKNKRPKRFLSSPNFLQNTHHQQQHHHQQQQQTENKTIIELKRALSSLWFLQKPFSERRTILERALGLDPLPLLLLYPKTKRRSSCGLKRTFTAPPITTPSPSSSSSFATPNPFFPLLSPSFSMKARNSLLQRRNGFEQSLKSSSSSLSSSSSSSLSSSSSSSIFSSGSSSPLRSPLVSSLPKSVLSSSNETPSLSSLSPLSSLSSLSSLPSSSSPEIISPEYIKLKEVVESLRLREKTENERRNLLSLLLIAPQSPLHLSFDAKEKEKKELREKEKQQHDFQQLQSQQQREHIDKRKKNEPSLYLNKSSLGEREGEGEGGKEGEKERKEEKDEQQQIPFHLKHQEERRKRVESALNFSLGKKKPLSPSSPS